MIIYLLLGLVSLAIIEAKTGAQELWLRIVLIIFWPIALLMELSGDKKK